MRNSVSNIGVFLSIAFLISVAGCDFTSLFSRPELNYEDFLQQSFPQLHNDDSDVVSGYSYLGSVGGFIGAAIVDSDTDIGPRMTEAGFVFSKSPSVEVNELYQARIKSLFFQDERFLALLAEISPDAMSLENTNKGSRECFISTATNRAVLIAVGS